MPEELNLPPCEVTIKMSGQIYNELERMAHEDGLSLPQLFAAGVKLYREGRETQVRSDKEIIVPIDRSSSAK